MIARLLLAALAGVSIAASAADAAPQPAARPAAPALSPEDQALVQKAAAYLDGLRLVRGRFEQTDARGGVAQGELYLSRPGRARFEYQGGAPRLVVADGVNVLVMDQRLKSFDRYPLGSTPLALFLQRNITLTDKVVVTRVERFPGGFAITARDGRRQALGQITIAFRETPAMGLMQWSILDAQGGRTTVKLSDLRQVASLDPALFVLRGPQRVGRP